MQGWLSTEDIPGLPSIFDSPDSHGPAIVAACSVSIGLMWPVFLLRAYLRFWVNRTFGWDDGKSLNGLKMPGAINTSQ